MGEGHRQAFCAGSSLLVRLGGVEGSCAPEASREVKAEDFTSTNLDVLATSAACSTRQALCNHQLLTHRRSRIASFKDHNWRAGAQLSGRVCIGPWVQFPPWQNQFNNNNSNNCKGDRMYTDIANERRKKMEKANAVYVISKMLRKR